MVTLLGCPNPEGWQMLFDDTVSPGEREHFERHLESCPACQERLDRDEELGGELRGLARQVGDPTAVPADPTLLRFLEKLHEGKSRELPAPAEALDMYFPRLTDRQGVLGTLGDYEVREVIGQGGMGVVLKAYEPALQRLVAIKVLAPALAGSVTARRRFTREAQAAAAVCHDHVVAVHGVHEAAGLPYLVMQFIEGESLQERLDRVGPLEVEEVVRIGMQTAAGLAAAHAQGLIHRDVKPANLLLENGLAKVKITDFGLARLADDIGLTQAGVVAGTPEYMAPEQARGESVDHRADLFSLGSVLYACCTGIPPFRGGSAVAVLRRVSDEEPARVRELNPDIPAWLEELIMRLLAKDPEQRIQSAAEIAALLEGYLAHLQQPTVLTPPELPPRRGEVSAATPGGLGGTARPPTTLLAAAPVASQASPARGVWGDGTPPQTPSASRGLPSWLPAFLLLAAVGLGMGVWFLADDRPTKQAQEAGRAQPARGHVVFDFRAGIATFPALSLYGPNTDTVMKTDAQGLRVTLPGGQGDTRPVGVETSQRLRGDFDIVLGYELITIGEPVPQYGAGVALRVWFDPDASLMALVSRTKKPSKESFGAHKVLKGPDGKDQYLNNVDVKATRSKGKLRLARTGPQLQYLVAEEGQNFKIIQTVEIGTADVQTLKVDCTTMYAPIALDLRLTELAIDADQFPDGIPSARAPAAPTEASPEPERKGLLTAVVLSVLTLLGVGVVGVWLYVRQRKDAGRNNVHAPTQGQQPKAEPAPAAVPIQCPQCGRRSKAKAELAGKKVKCPQCGEAVVVPATAQ